MRLALYRLTAFGLLAALGLLSGCGSPDDADQSTDRSEGSDAVAAEESPIVEAEGDGGVAGGAETVSTPVPTPHPKGRKAPDFALQTLDGSALRLSDLSGQVVIVDFWATWCGPCKRSIPDLIELQNEFKEQGFTIVGVSLDRRGADPAGAVRNFVEKMSINYPIVMGSPEVVQDYGGVKFIPTAFIVDKEGFIAKQITGLQPKAEIRKEIVKLLEG